LWKTTCIFIWSTRKQNQDQTWKHKTKSSDHQLWRVSKFDSYYFPLSHIHSLFHPLAPCFNHTWEENPLTHLLYI
jgi:hypothetical protein